MKTLDTRARLVHVKKLHKKKKYSAAVAFDIEIVWQKFN